MPRAMKIEPSVSLVLMCKRPRLHQGKQRLAAVIGPTLTLSIAEGLLECTLEDAKQWPGPVVIAISHTRDLIWAQNLIPTAEVIYQGEGNLGQRINHIDSTLRACGHQKLVFIGTDAPMLTNAFYQGVQPCLEKADVVLTQAEDGGVVMMACNHAWPELTKLPWSTENLAAHLASLCVNHGMRLHYHQHGYDIDEFSNLARLSQDLMSDKRPARQHLLMRLNACLDELEGKKLCMT